MLNGPGPKSFKSKDSAKYITYYVVFFILMFPLVFVALTSKDKPRVEILGQFNLGKSSRKGICCPINKDNFIPWNHPDISLRFRAEGRRVKKFIFFHEISLPHATFFCRPAADSILMPLTFPIARLNRYTPNFSGVPQKLTWCQQFGLQIFPK